VKWVDSVEPEVRQRITKVRILKAAAPGVLWYVELYDVTLSQCPM
jgi:hypothetical protein